MKKKKLLLPFIIILILTITFAASTAIFNYVKKGINENYIKLGDITFVYEENQLGNSINLTDSFPISDSEGKNQLDEGSYFDFKISSVFSSIFQL